MRVKVDKNDIKKLYLNGYNAKQISSTLEVTVESVRKYIQRNFDHLKRKHEVAVIARKETVKAVNYEASKCMSDKSFVKKNRSIYKTKINGDIVINKDVAPVVTWDTPKRLVNENKSI